MSDFFIGEIRLFPYATVPSGWLPCMGQKLLIADYPGLFQYIKNLYGGDGEVNFLLPDLRGRLLVGSTPNRTPGSLGMTGTYGGVESVVIPEFPPHHHEVYVSTEAAKLAPPGRDVLLSGGVTNQSLLYAPAGAAPTPLNTATVASVGAAAPRENRQPFLAMQYCISTTGNPPPYP